MAARDTNFIFSCWKYLSRVSKANLWEILSAREDKIRIPKRPCIVLFILFILMKFQKNRVHDEDMIF